MRLNRPLILGLAACAALGASSAEAQLRIANYNLRGDSGTLGAGFDKVLQGIGNDNTVGFAKPIDVLLVQETDAQNTTTQQIVDILNTLYGAGTYARGTVDGATTGGGRPGIVYRTSSLSLVAEVQVGTASTSGAARAPMRYQFRPVGYSSTADFYIYNSHYKASDSSSDRARRLAEANQIRQNADALGQGARIIYGGDFNSYYSNEPMFIGGSGSLGLESAGNGQGHDPINSAGSWNNNAAFVSIATQAPLVTTPNGSGLVGGGLNSRFDLQYVTDEMLSGEGVSYLTGSYHTFMNNGSVPLNQAINSASNNALPSLPNRSQVLTALTTATDHLPLVVDYQVPAKMAVTVGTLSTVITGASVNLALSVTNNASALTVAGADELDYTGSGAGKLSGAFSGTDNALGGSNAHQLALNTSTPGLAAGTVTVTASSAGAASANFSQAVSATVLAHANPTLSAASDENSATIDFGIRAGETGSATTAFALQNHADASGFTAGLKLLSISGSGATSKLTTNAATFSNLAAGVSNLYTAALNTGSYGTFSATYTFATADQDLPGALARENLVLSLSGIVALGGDATLDGFVDTADFNALAGNFGSGTTWSTGDFNRDGLVDSTDFGMLIGNFGQRVTMASPSLGTVVPEPASLSICLLGLFASARRRR